MNWKRTKISFVFWFFYLVIVGVSAYVTLDAFCGQHGIKGNIIYAILIGVLLAGGLFSVCVFWLKNRLLPELKENAILWHILEILGFLGALVSGILLRIQNLPNANAGNLYELAIMRYRTPVPELAQGAENLYLHILHGICFLLGNTPYFCIRFHLVLTILVGVAWYFGVRKMAGGIAALAVSYLYFLDPHMIEKSLTISAEPASLFAYGIGLALVGGYLKKHEGFWICYVLTGIWIGICGYLDLLGWTLLIFVLSVYHVEKQTPESKVHGKLISLLLLFLGCLIGFLGCILGKVLSSGKKFSDIIQEWANLYSFKGYQGVENIRLFFGSVPGGMVSLVVIAFCVMGVFSFFMKGNRERISPWIAALSICFLIMPFGIAYQETFAGLEDYLNGFTIIAEYPFDGSTLAILCFYVLAGLGIYGLFTPKVIENTETERNRIKAPKRESFDFHKWVQSVKQKKEARKAALIYAVDHPEMMDGKGPVTKFFYARAKKKVQNQRDIDKVMYALNSLSGDRVVIEDFTRDPHPEETAKEKNGGIFHLKKHGEEENNLREGDREEERAEIERAETGLSENAQKENDQTENAQKESVQAKKAQTESALEDSSQTEITLQEITRTENAKEDRDLTKITQIENAQKEDVSGKNDQENNDLERNENEKNIKNKLDQEPAMEIMVEKKEEGKNTEEKTIKEKTIEEIKTEENQTEETQAEETQAEEKKVVEKIAEEKTIAAKGMEENKVEEKIVVAKPAEEKEEVTENRNKKEKKSWKMGRKKDMTKQETKTEAEEQKKQVSEGQVENGEKPRMLENPLPLPKKPVYNPMDYDYEVADDDDYDIKDDD